MVFQIPLLRDMNIEESTMESPASPASRVLCGMLCSSPRHGAALEQKQPHPTDDDIVDAGGNLPLHRAVESFAMDCLSSPHDRPLLEENIASLVHDDPQAVRVYNHRGYLPLHIACREGASLAVIQTLVQVWPESVQCPTRNQQQMLPLHLVCRFSAGPAREKLRVLHYLLGAHPAAAQVANGKGDLALHLALQNFFSTLAVVELLVQSYPESVRTVNDRHQLPLHIACAHHYMRRVPKKANSKSKTKTTDRDDKENSCRSSDMIRYLLQEYPSGAQVLDRTGSLPLHAAVKGCQRPSTIQLLLEACPEAIEHADGSGRTALHLAVSRPEPHVEMVELLLQAHPAAADAVDQWNKRPIHYAETSSRRHSNRNSTTNLMSILAGSLVSDERRAISG